MLLSCEHFVSAWNVSRRILRLAQRGTMLSDSLQILVTTFLPKALIAYVLIIHSCIYLVNYDVFVHARFGLLVPN